jgi:glycoside/pentoside/hexuronide:cation symporter, GPH family
VDQGAIRTFLEQWHLPIINQSTDVSQMGLMTKFMVYSKLVIYTDKDNYSMAYGLLQMTNKVCNVAGIIAAAYLVSRFSKKMVVTVSCALNTVFIFALYFVPVTHMTANSLWAIFVLEWMGQLAYAPCVPLLWVLFADVCDYTEWKTGRNIAGFTYATFFFALKAGNSLGNFMQLQMMKYFEYQANVAQTEKTKMGIMLTFSLVPGIISLARVGSMLCYKITKKMNNEISDELANRRAAAKG